MGSVLVGLRLIVAQWGFGVNKWGGGIKWWEGKGRQALGGSRVGESQGEGKGRGSKNEIQEGAAFRQPGDSALAFFVVRRHKSLL